MNHRSFPRRVCLTPTLRTLLLALSPVHACAPELAAPCSDKVARIEPSTNEADAGPELQIEPAAPPDAAPPVLRLRVRLPGTRPGDVDLARVLLFRGPINAAHLRQIEQGELSKALSERIVPSLAWLEEPPSGELWLTVAPLSSLAPGETYAVAGGSPVFSHEIQVAAADLPPILPRLWPPPGAGATLALGIWCGDAPLPDDVVPAALAPDGPAGELRRGAVDGIGARCLRFASNPTGEQTGTDTASEQAGTDKASEQAGTTPAGEQAATDTASERTGTEELRFVGPPAAGGSPPTVSLDPRPFAIESEPLHAQAVPCEPEEMILGPGCAYVADDRIRVRSADVPLLWAIAGEGLDEVVSVRPGESFIISPLPPISPISLTVATIDNAGRVDRQPFSAVTLPPSPHVIINEILANPIGPEPAQEWVELYNDGSVPADLTGYVLLDVGGETVLPPAVLAPGAYALVVNEAYVLDAELDPSPTPETLLLRVPKLGNHGLSNTGEPLKLVDSGGAVLSRSPAMSVPKAGMSLARARPRALDDSAGNFVTGWPTPGRENIMNQEIP